jgi:hypothetical protein
MTKTFNIIDCDVIYLSYDEPNAEKNYADLLTKCPWAKRVHGVEGSDSAHKACAKLADTERIVIIDGDNIVNPKFFEQTIEIDSEELYNRSVVSWCALNVVNGLMYGNGGIKSWPREFVLNMKTHENADANNPQSQVDFCWDINYITLDECMSWVYNNATPWQAWRAGFREGVKMSLTQGVKLENTKKFIHSVHKKNYHRLLAWLNVGSDVENGYWAMFGARQGCYMTNCTDWDYVNVRDFKWLNQFWEDQNATLTEDRMKDEVEILGEKLKSELDIPVSSPLDPIQSKFFKEVFTNPSRVTTGARVVKR